MGSGCSSGSGDESKSSMGMRCLALMVFSGFGSLGSETDVEGRSASRTGENMLRRVSFGESCCCRGSSRCCSCCDRKLEALAGSTFSNFGSESIKRIDPVAILVSIVGGPRSGCGRNVLF